MKTTTTGKGTSMREQAIFVMLGALVGCGNQHGYNNDADFPDWLFSLANSGDISIEYMDNGHIKFETTSTDAKLRLDHYLKKFNSDYVVQSTQTHKETRAFSENMGITRYIDDPFLRCRVESTQEIAKFLGRTFYVTTGITEYEKTPVPVDYQTVWAAVAVPHDTSHLDSAHIDPAATGSIPIKVEKTVAVDVGGFPRSDHTCCMSRIERSCSFWSCRNETVTRCMDHVLLP